MTAFRRSLPQNRGFEVRGCLLGPMGVGRGCTAVCRRLAPLGLGAVLVGLGLGVAAGVTPGKVLAYTALRNAVGSIFLFPTFARSATMSLRA